MSKFIPILAALALVFTVGCGKKPKLGQPVVEAVAESETAVNEPASEAATVGQIVGKVIFSGTPPAAAAIKMDADPFCKSHAQSAESETYVVDAGGGLKNVLIYLKSGYKGKKIPPSQGKVELDQVNCHYVPHVAAARVNQPILIKNSDGTLHNVHGIGKANKEFNFGQPTQGMVTEKTFASPEVAIRFKCDVHPWMAAHLAILEHPWFAVSANDGSFTIADVPPGTYTVEAWHEAMPAQTAEVTVSGGDTPVEFTFQK